MQITNGMSVSQGHMLVPSSPPLALWRVLHIEGAWKITV